PLCHIANSGGALQIPESRLDMVRCGILMYGVYPAPHLQERVSVQLCMRWVSRIVYFKVVRPFHPVSYGSTWQSEEETRIVTIPVGYGDGYPRSMSNRAEVLIRGKRYPIVGRICMDQAMVNIGWDEAYNGEEVILLGSQGNECIKPEELAIWASTITYEILCTINARVPRHYIYG
ncbi:MAG: alanine racemase, partial [Myxococcota bacterium]|nr:alanine racemase [Myxococcota bacterium]